MEECMTAISVPMITALVYAVITAIKEASGENEKIKRFIPLIALVLGCAIAIFSYLYAPELLGCSDVITAAVTGAVSGLAATGGNQIIKQLKK